MLNYISKRVVGKVIFLSFLLGVFSYFFNLDSLIIAGIMLWIAMIYLFRSIKSKKIVQILLLTSLTLLIYILVKGYKVDFYRLFTINHSLISLLIGVGFLKLIAKPKNISFKTLPQGKSAFIKTYLGVHLFGSVINLSALVLIADKMYKKMALQDSQIILLTRGFVSCAFWSPFFVAFAATSTYIPDFNLYIIMINGLFLSFMVFLITYYDVKKFFNIDNFFGYPISFESLCIPFTLAVFVLIAHHYLEQKVIILISLFSLLFVFIILPLKYGLKNAYYKFINHIDNELPQMKAELALFLVAGMFGVVVSTLLSNQNIELPITNFDWIIASITLFTIILLSFLGIHPIISIAILAEYLVHIADHTLLATTFLMSWSISVSTSPLSGVNLAVMSRYSIESIRILKLNITYALKIYLFCIVILYLIDKNI